MSPAQTLAPKGSKAVTVEVGEGAFIKVSSTLAGRGYLIAHSDEAAGIVTTQAREVGGLQPVKVKLSAAVSGSSVMLRGSYAFGSFEDNPNDIEAAGMAGSPSAKAWAELEAVALALGEPVAFQ